MALLRCQRLATRELNGSELSPGGPGIGTVASAIVSRFCPFPLPIESWNSSSLGKVVFAEAAYSHSFDASDCHGVLTVCEALYLAVEIRGTFWTVLPLRESLLIGNELVNRTRPCELFMI